MSKARRSSATSRPIDPLSRVIDLSNVEEKGGEVTSGRIQCWGVFCQECFSFLLAEHNKTLYAQCQCGRCMAWLEEGASAVTLHMQGPNKIFYQTGDQNP